MTKRIVLAALAALTLAAPALAGGFARIQFSEIPKTVVAGKPVTVVFSAENVAHRPWSGLNPVVVATCGPQRLEFPATEVKDARYSATFALPNGGRWAFTVDSRLCTTRCAAKSVTVLAAK